MELVTAACIISGITQLIKKLLYKYDVSPQILCSILSLIYSISMTILSDSSMTVSDVGWLAVVLALTANGCHQTAKTCYKTALMYIKKNLS